MNRRQWLWFVALLAAGGILCAWFPLFHIQRRGRGGDHNAEPSLQLAAPGGAEPIAYVRKFWNSPRRTGEDAVEISRLWQAFAEDAATAKSTLGRQVGLGGAWHFLVVGEGVVETAGESTCTLVVADSPQRALLDLGAIVDNTVREAIGVDVNEFANSQDYNAVSSELNRLVEYEVIEKNRARLTSGTAVRFVGCAKIEKNSDIDPLRLAPIWLDVGRPDAAGIDQGGAPSEEGSPARIAP